MNVDTLIKNAEVVLESGIARLDLGISDGVIVALVADSAGIEAGETIDADGKLLLPGAIDIHFHCRAPGLSTARRFRHRNAGCRCRRRDHRLRNADLQTLLRDRRNLRHAQGIGAA